MKDIKEVLELHEKWLNNEEGGVRADLKYANLICADLSNCNLSGADLTNADLRNTNLKYANLKNANLEGADLTNAYLVDVYLSNANLRNSNLSNSNLRNSILSGTDLTNAYLVDVDLRYADLKGANLRETNLTGADLTNAYLVDVDLSNANLEGANIRQAILKNTNLNNIKYNYLSIGLNLVCPEKGSYIGYKKAKNKDRENVIVELLITEDSLRSSSTTRKCRCSKARVLSITSLDKTKSYNEAYSNYDNSFIYKVGEIVSVDNFNTNRWDECSTGIHHFISRKEAVKY